MFKYILLFLFATTAYATEKGNPHHTHSEGPAITNVYNTANYYGGIDDGARDLATAAAMKPGPYWSTHELQVFGGFSPGAGVIGLGLRGGPVLWTMGISRVGDEDRVGAGFLWVPGK